MYYRKYMEDGKLVSLLTFEQEPYPTVGLLEITEEEYLTLLAEILAASKEDEPQSPPAEVS